MIFKNPIIILFYLMLVLSMQAGSWRWEKKNGKHIDLTYDDKKIARYVYEKMDPNDRTRTYKPFHHIFQSNGKDLLTKGPGGKFSHHRGIYYGFSKCKAFDKQGKQIIVDTWHCKRGYQVHEKILNQQADNQSASHTVEISWKIDDGEIFAKELRTLSFSIQTDRSIQIDFKSKLSTNQKEIGLDGDPQHAGFQFRASNEVAEKTKNKTYYIRPNEERDENGKTKNWPGDRDMINLLWKAQCILVNEKRYTTIYMDHPNNPKPSFYSERDYGRFWIFF